MYRRNAAERAIQTSKDHLLSGLVACHSQFPITKWDRLLQQAKVTLNLLRTSRVNPKLSAHSFINGPFDFNAAPIAPPGSKVVIHKKSDSRNSWDYRGKTGWYIGPAMHHYRCVHCYVPSTHAEITADTVKFLPEKIPFPQATMESYLKQAVSDIITILKQPKHFNIPRSQFSSNTKNVLEKFAQLLNCSTPLPSIKYNKYTTTHLNSDKILSIYNNAQLLRVKTKVVVSDPRVNNNTWESIEKSIKKFK